MDWLKTQWNEHSKGIIQSIVGGLVLLAMAAIYRYEYGPVLELLTNLNWSRIIWVSSSILGVGLLCFFGIDYYRLKKRLASIQLELEGLQQELKEKKTSLDDRASRLEDGLKELEKDIKLVDYATMEDFKNLKANSKDLGEVLVKHGEAITYSENKTRELEENNESLLKGFEKLSDVVTDTIDRQLKTDESRWNAHNELVARISHLESS